MSMGAPSLTCAMGALLLIATGRSWYISPALGQDLLPLTAGTNCDRLSSAHVVRCRRA